MTANLGYSCILGFSVNFKPRFGGEQSNFTLQTFFWRSEVHFSSHKHVKLRVLMILSWVPKTVSWTASSEISLSVRFKVPVKWVQVTLANRREKGIDRFSA